jgi:hypothetical protein
MEAALGGPGDSDCFAGLAGLSLSQPLANGRSFAVMPGGLDQQPTGVRRPGLGDRPEPSVISGPEL